MCDLYLTEEAKERIANLRESKGRGRVYEQSLICRAMSAIIFEADGNYTRDKEEMLQALCVLQQYNDLITELSKEN